MELYGFVRLHARAGEERFVEEALREVTRLSRQEPGRLSMLGPGPATLFHSFAVGGRSGLRRPRAVPAHAALLEPGRRTHDPRSSSGAHEANWLKFSRIMSDAVSPGPCEDFVRLEVKVASTGCRFRMRAGLVDRRGVGACGLRRRRAGRRRGCRG